MTTITKHAFRLVLALLLVAVVAPNTAKANCDTAYGSCLDGCSNRGEICQWVTLSVCTVVTVAGSSGATTIVCALVSQLVCQELESSCESECDEAYEECEDYENSGCS